MHEDRIQTGVPGLDQLLGGGLLARNLYLIKGAPGSGKTTLALQFLVEGARQGEKALYVGLSETRGQIGVVAQAFGWSLDGVEVHEMRRRKGPGDEKSYSVFSPSEVELEEISGEILEQVEKVAPDRLVLDSLSEIRLLAQDPFRYRREVLTLSDRISDRIGAGLLIDVDTQEPGGLVAETLVSGVIELQQFAPAYGGERRQVRVRKMRASRSLGGYHDFSIGDHGIEIYPRLVAAAHRSEHSSAEISSGIAELDALLGGGLDRGTSTLFMGPAGTGKSTLAAQFVTAAAERGEPGVFFCFDESPTNLLVRTGGLGIPLDKHVKTDLVHLVPVDPAELTPGELSHQAQVEIQRGVRVLVLDSVNGYLNAMPDQKFLAAHLHELLAFLSEKGVATLLTVAQQSSTGSAEAPINISYIADTVVLLRFFEALGKVRQAISIIKKRTGAHERTIRELELGAQGVRIGEPLTDFQGVLTGNPKLMSGSLLGGEREPPK
ncbi:MAG: ATPase domain-containing protein [Myxococcota bacterium]